MPCYYAGEHVILSTVRLIGSRVWRPVTWKNGQGALFSRRRMLSDRNTLDREVEGKKEYNAARLRASELEQSKERWYLTLHAGKSPMDSRSTHMVTHHVDLRGACPAPSGQWTPSRRGVVSSKTAAQAERTRSNCAHAFTQASD
jgi:hypothetical protein